ncbi:MAG: hypothetical protein RLZZ156_1301 [Deinococcota bacterium]
MTWLQTRKKKKTSMTLELKDSRKNQPIDYLGALQSIFKLADDFNHRLGARVEITHVTWGFYLDREGKTCKSVELNLATSATPKEDLAWLEFTVGQSAFTGQTLATSIPAFSDALKSALKTCLDIVESSHSKADGGTLTNSQVTIALILDDRNQLILTEGSRDTQNDVIHKITFTLQ